MVCCTQLLPMFSMLSETVDATPHFRRWAVDEEKQEVDQAAVVSWLLQRMLRDDCRRCYGRTILMSEQVT